MVFIFIVNMFTLKKKIIIPKTFHDYMLRLSEAGLFENMVWMLVGVLPGLFSSLVFIISGEGECAGQARREGAHLLPSSPYFQTLPFD